MTLCCQTMEDHPMDANAVTDGQPQDVNRAPVQSHLPLGLCLLALCCFIFHFSFFSFSLGPKTALCFDKLLPGEPLPALTLMIFSWSQFIFFGSLLAVPALLAKEKLIRDRSARSCVDWVALACTVALGGICLWAAILPLFRLLNELLR